MFAVMSTTPPPATPRTASPPGPLSKICPRGGSARTAERERPTFPRKTDFCFAAVRGCLPNAAALLGHIPQVCSLAPPCLGRRPASPRLRKKSVVHNAPLHQQRRVFRICPAGFSACPGYCMKAHSNRGNPAAVEDRNIRAAVRSCPYRTGRRFFSFFFCFLRRSVV